MRYRPRAFLRVCAMFLAAGLTGCDQEPAGPPDASPPDVSRPPHVRGAAFDGAKQARTLSTGITMTYVEAGDSDGEAVILLHGYTDTSRSFFQVLETLAANGTALHLFALDQRGHGASSMPSDSGCAAAPETCFAPALMAEDVIAFMDALNLASAHVVGHSMGSLVAQELALAHATRVQSLMLIGTFVNGENPTFNEFLVPLVEGTDASAGQWRGMLEGSRPGLRWPIDAYDLTPADADPRAREFVAAVWVTDPTADPSFLAEIVPETTATRLGTWIGAVRAQHAFDSRTRLAGLTVPALVIWATQDSLFPEQQQQLVRAALDNAVDRCNLDHYYYKTYGKIPLPASGLQETDFGHNVQWGAHEAIAADLTAWVTTGEPTDDLPFADPNDPSQVVNDRGAADVIERRRVSPCAAE